MSFGDSLIKRVAETLSAEFPRLRHYATLSPMTTAGFADLGSAIDESGFDTKTASKIKAMMTDLPYEAHGLMPKVIGVDVARYGDDKSVVVVRQGRKVLVAGSKMPTV